MPFTVRKSGDKFRVFEGGSPARNSSGIRFGPLGEAAANNLRDRLAKAAAKSGEKKQEPGGAAGGLGRAIARRLRRLGRK